jgi:hypothetical protein
VADETGTPSIEGLPVSGYFQAVKAHPRWAFSFWAFPNRQSEVIGKLNRHAFRDLPGIYGR